MKHLFKTLPAWMKVFGVIVMTVAGFGAFLASYWPVLLGGILDDVSVGVIDTIDKGMAPFLLFGVIILGAETLSVVRRVAVDLVAARYEEQLRIMYNPKILRLPLSYLHGKQRTSAELVALLNEAVTGASQLIKLLANELFSAVLISGFMIIQTVIGAPIQITFVLIAYVLLSILVSILQIKSQQGMRVQIISKKAKQNGTVVQSIDNIEIIRMSNAENYEASRQLPGIQGIRSVESKHHVWMGSFDIAKQTVKSATFIALLFLSVYLIAEGAMIAGTAITVILLFQGMVGPVETVYRFIDEVSAAVAKVKVLNELYDQGDDPIFAVPDAPASAFTGNAILLDHASILSPETGSPISIVDSAVIDASIVTGVQGESGSGKSSVFRGLMGYYSYSGSITVFGVPANMISRAQLAKLIAYIPQGNHFFVGTIRENLAYGLETLPTDSQLLKALEMSCLLYDLSGRGLNALDINLEEGASGLSGGQAQRLKLARAFLRKPRLFILDEPDTGLDDITTQKALNNLLNYARDIAAGVCFVTHRDTVIRLCNSRIEIHKPPKTKAA